MSKSIFLTGLILGKETEMCTCPDINYGWLFTRPSDLLWMDKLIVTRNEWNELMKGGEEVSEEDFSAMKNAVKLVFEKLDDEGLVQIIPDTIIGQARAESILETIEDDLSLISDLCTPYNDGKGEFIQMGKYRFCVPMLWTLYAAIEISRDTNASFSLEQDEMAYLSALIPRKFSYEIKAGRNMAMDEVLRLCLPSVQLGHNFLNTSPSGKCNDCARKLECGGSYMSNVEKQIDNIITLRQYDEIRMTCEIMDRLCERSAEVGHVLTGEELWGDLQEEAELTRRRVRKALPKVKFWRRLSTFVSIGLGAASFFNPLVGATAAIPAVAAQLLTSAEDKMRRETSWVSFVNNPDSILSRAPRKRSIFRRK